MFIFINEFGLIKIQLLKQNKQTTVAFMHVHTHAHTNAHTHAHTRMLTCTLTQLRTDLVLTFPQQDELIKINRAHLVRSGWIGEGDIPELYISH